MTSTSTSTSTSTIPPPPAAPRQRRTLLLRSHITRSHNRSGITSTSLPHAYTPHVFPDGLININHQYGTQANATKTQIAAEVATTTKDRVLRRHAEHILSRDPPLTKKSVLQMAESWITAMEQGQQRKKKGKRKSDLDFDALTPRVTATTLSSSPSSTSTPDNPELTPLLTSQSHQLLTLISLRNKRQRTSTQMSAEERHVFEEVEKGAKEILTKIPPNQVMTLMG